MKTRVFTFILAVLPLALTAQASEISMDAGGTTAASSANASGAKGDCASARSLRADQSDAAIGNNDSRHSSAGSNSSRMRVSDEVAGETDTDASTGSSAAGKSLAVPVKTRSTRWQSLVPGAIK